MIQDKAMQDKMMNAFTEQTNKIYTPMRKVNALLVDNMEKMTDFQLDALKVYSSIGLSQMKRATEAKDADTVRDYTASHIEMVSKLSKKMVEDARTIADMSAEFKAELKAILEQSRSQDFNNAEESKAKAKPAATATTK